VFGKQSLSDDYAPIIKAIAEGERHKPQHERPRTVGDSGLTSFVTPAHEVVFADFDCFAAVLIHQVTEPWSIEETSDTLVDDRRSDSPDVGRTYVVYYNSLRMGRLQVTVGTGDDVQIFETAEWFLEHRAALAILELDYLRWVPYDDAHSLISALEFLLGSFEDRKNANARASSAATAALTAYLWESVRVENSVMSFDHRVDGPYELLRMITEHWKTNGIDPFERWGGDRPDYSASVSKSSG